MAVLRSLFVLYFAGNFVVNVMTAYNPLLTYTARFQKFSYQPNITGNCTVNKYREKEFVNGFISVKSNEPLSKVIVIFTRCNPEGINCEYFQSWTLTTICSLLKDKNQMWSSWYGAFDPPAICPISNQIFHVKNGSIEIGPAIRWYPDVINYYWKVTQKLYAGEQYIGGYTFDLAMFSFRKRGQKH